MKKTIEHFLFAVTLVVSLGIIVVGVSLASLRSSEMTNGKSYASVVFANSAEKLEIGSEKRTVFIDKAFFKEAERYTDLLYLTPFGTVWGIAVGIYEFNEE